MRDATILIELAVYGASSIAPGITAPPEEVRGADLRRKAALAYGNSPDVKKLKTKRTLMKTRYRAAWKSQLLSSLVALCSAAHCHNGWAADSATGPAPQDWSRVAQQKVENFSEQALAAEKITVSVQSSKNDFLKSKPSIKDGKILIQAYVPAPAERGSSYDEIWCKLKTQGAITDATVAAAQGEP